MKAFWNNEPKNQKVNEQRSLKSISNGLFKRLEQFRLMSDETKKDIKVLGCLKEDNSKRIAIIQNENQDINSKVKEAESFVHAIDSMFGFTSKNGEQNEKV